jgi:cytochrome c oxidase subunit 2
MHKGLRRMFNTLSRVATARMMALVAGLMTSPIVYADWALDMPTGVTTTSDGIFGLHRLIMMICFIVAVLVFGTLIYALIKFRKSKGATAAKFDHSTQAEVIWTTVPVLILIFMAVPAAQQIIKIEDASNPDMTIKVTGYQWMWQYEYLDEDIAFYSVMSEDSTQAARLGSGVDPYSVEHYLRDVDKPMVVPVGKKIRLLLTANDVIHAWWVPELYVKKDAIPGFINELWFEAEKPGTYRGQCAELCGRGHGFMPIVVIVKTEAEYNEWVQQQKSGTSVASAAAH